MKQSNTEQSEPNGLRTLEDISSIILNSHDLQETLDNIVNTVARRMNTDVCSIYLLEADGETLVLKASKGLAKSAIGKIAMKISEGLSGLVIQTCDVVMTDNAPAHPRYKYFKASKEEQYYSYLGLPLFDRKTPTGVIVVQTVAPRLFSDDEISVLKTITFQIGSILMNARLLDSVQAKEQERAFYEAELNKLRTTNSRIDHKTLKSKGKLAKSKSMIGIPASPGFCSGSVFILDRYNPGVIKAKKAGSVQDELNKLKKALESTVIQTIYMEKKVNELLSANDAAIFHTHLMILEDRAFTSRIEEMIQQGFSAAWSVHETVQEYVEAFSKMEDPYLRERSADVLDIGRRIIDAIEGNSNNKVRFRGKRVLVAEDIFPSDMATLNHDNILGIVTEKGNSYSHATIMAKTLGIPAVVGVEGLLDAVTPKDQAVIDGNAGYVYINPEKNVYEEYQRLEQEYTSRVKELEYLRDLPAITTDGVRITLCANIGLISDIKAAVENGAEGVGLYRTEFPYMARSSFPNRTEQTALYRKILEGFPKHTVNIRTLDIGGDKGLPYYEHPQEANPFLGWRSIRFTLDEQQIFRDQLASILMAAKYGNPTIMFPLISSTDEIFKIKSILQEVTRELQDAGLIKDIAIPLGIMVELPAAVQIIDLLAKEVDYMSIGTNDLIQYMLAADRNNPQIKSYYNPCHPAVLRAIKQVADAGNSAGKKVSLCGEMAADPLLALLLIGLGVREFSLSAPGIPLVKQTIIANSFEKCREIANTVLACNSADAINKYLEQERKILDRT